MAAAGSYLAEGHSRLVENSSDILPVVESKARASRIAEWCGLQEMCGSEVLPRASGQNA